eukprot:5021443-Karenia_brevis.AAC.1
MEKTGSQDQARAELSKQIQKQIRKDLRNRKRCLVSETVERFSDLKTIGNIRKLGRRANLASVYDTDGSLQTSRQAVADVFANFYEELYRSREEAS